MNILALEGPSRIDAEKHVSCQSWDQDEDYLLYLTGSDTMSRFLAINTAMSLSQAALSKVCGRGGIMCSINVQVKTELT